MKNPYYTAIGSRKTPIYILYMMAKISNILEKKGYILRSGKAKGADLAFELGLEYPEKSSEIYIPNKNFVKSMGNVNPHLEHIIPIQNKLLYNEASNIIRRKNIHKKWEYISNNDVWMLQNRNVFQVLGKDLRTPSKFLICYTKDGANSYESTSVEDTGGTGSAINLASIENIEIINLKNIDDRIRLNNFIEKNEHLINYDLINNITFISDFNNLRNIYNNECSEFLKPLKVKDLDPNVLIDHELLELKSKNKKKLKI